MSVANRVSAHYKNPALRVALCLAILTAIEIQANEPSVSVREDSIDRAIANAQSSVNRDVERLRTASLMSKLAAARVGKRRNVDLVAARSPIFGQLGTRFALNDYDNAEVQQAVLRLFPPVGGQWVDLRTIIPHAEMAAKSLYKRGLNPLAHVEQLRTQNRRDKLLIMCKLYYIEQIYQHEDKTKAVSLLAEELVSHPESIIAASYLSVSLTREAFEAALDKMVDGSYLSKMLPAFAVIGDSDSLKMMSVNRHRFQLAAEQFDAALATVEYRLGLEYPQVQRAWSKQESEFLQVEIPPDFSAGGDYSGCLLAGALRARYHGATFESQFLRQKLPDPVAIIFLGIEADKKNIPALEKLRNEESLHQDLIDWSIATIKDGGIPIGYGSLYRARYSE